jgi:hypothetical protein
MKLKNIRLYKITWIKLKNPSDQILKIKQKILSENYSIKNKKVNKKVLQANSQSTKDWKINKKLNCLLLSKVPHSNKNRIGNSYLLIKFRERLIIWYN